MLSGRYSLYSIWHTLDSFLENPGSRGAVIGTLSVAFGLLAMFSSGIRLSGDPEFFLYSGLLSAHGYPTYVHLFDIKPPGIHLLTWGLAELAGGDPWLLYIFGVVLSSGITIGIFVLTDAYVTMVTKSPPAGTLAAFALLVHDFWQYPALGLYTKEIAALCFLSVFLSVHHHRFVLAGVVAAICASVWQMTAPLFILVLLLAIYHREWRAAGSMCVAAGFLAFLVILPFYLVDAHTAMVSQVIWPLFGAPTRFRFLEIFSVIGKANYIVLFAILGYVSTIFAEFEDTTTVRFTALATGIMWLIGTGSDNLDGADFVLFVPLLAVGIGYLVGYSAPTGSIASRMSPPVLFIGLLIGAAVLWTIPPLGDFFSEMPSQARLELYFQATPPETCYRGTNYGEEFLKAVPDTNQRTCWQPSAQELWQWTYRRIIT